VITNVCGEFRVGDRLPKIAMKRRRPPVPTPPCLATIKLMEWTLPDGIRWCQSGVVEATA